MRVVTIKGRQYDLDDRLDRFDLWLRCNGLGLPESIQLELSDIPGGDRTFPSGRSAYQVAVDNLTRWVEAEPDVSDAEWLLEAEGFGLNADEARRALDEAKGQRRLL